MEFFSIYKWGFSRFRFEWINIMHWAAFSFFLCFDLNILSLYKESSTPLNSKKKNTRNQKITAKMKRKKSFQTHIIFDNSIFLVTIWLWSVFCLCPKCTHFNYVVFFCCSLTLFVLFPSLLGYFVNQNLCPFCFVCTYRWINRNILRFLYFVPMICTRVESVYLVLRKPSI